MAKKSRRIALDAMGCDYGPAALVEGALSAIEKGPHEVLLVGKKRTLTRLLRERGYDPSHPGRISIVPADDVVTMDDKARKAIRKKESSIYVAADLVRKGKADGLVSAGNTAATMAITKLRLRMLPGITRPAIATIIPSQTHPCILLDAGANVDCKPAHLLHFGVMGAAYAHDILGRKKPEIGLLSIGEEEIKGNAQTAAAFDLFESTKLNFIGNVEGRDILNGRCDVIVCDGFVGNIVLKFGEALAEHILTHLKGRLKSNIISSLAGLAMRPTLRKFKEAMDPDEFGGAPLLGVNGACIICHGASNEKAIMNAIRVAGDCANNRVNDHIIADVEALDARAKK